MIRREGSTHRSPGMRRWVFVFVFVSAGCLALRSVVSTSLSFSDADSLPVTPNPSSAVERATPLDELNYTDPGLRLPNGGPSELYLEGWRAARDAFRPARPEEPIPFVVDWSVVGCVSRRRDDVSAAAPLLAGGGGHDETLVRRVLSRTRLGAVLCFHETNNTSPAAQAVLKGTVESAIRHELERYAPAWRIVEGSIDPSPSVEADALSPSAEVVVAVRLERRARLFVFAIAGGTDGRATYVERTWGRRTPVQWFADLWDPRLRPIVDTHPAYEANPFHNLTFKITRIWQRVFQDFGPATARTVATAGLARAQTYHRFAKAFRGAGYDWYVRLWDDNYFYEENIANVLVRLPPPTVPQLAGRVSWQALGPDNHTDNFVYPMAGGGVGWFLSSAAVTVFAASIPEVDAWMPTLLDNPHLLIRHRLHNEDVLLSRWIFTLRKVRFVNIPGVEHVSPGLKGKQRCMTTEQLHELRWDPNATTYFDYYPTTSRDLLIEAAPGANVKPVVWHYMTPRRLVSLETLLYAERKSEFPELEDIPTTRPDNLKPSQCYPPPNRTGEFQSVFDVRAPDPSVQWAAVQWDRMGSANT